MIRIYKRLIIHKSFQNEINIPTLNYLHTLHLNFLRTKKTPKIPDTYFFQETLLKSLAENDELIYLTLAPTRNDIDTALKYFDEPKNVSAKGVDSMFMAIQEKAGDNFKSLQKFTSVNHIDWTMIAEDSVSALPKKKFDKYFP